MYHAPTCPTLRGGFSVSLVHAEVARQTATKPPRHGWLPTFDGMLALAGAVVGVLTMLGGAGLL